METINIIADHREPKKILEKLEAIGSDVIIKQLELGDYLTSEKTVIERKTRQDFEQSIMNQRLFRQMSNLKENFENVIIIVEGTEPYLRLKNGSILGTYATIITDFHCSLFFTRNHDATAEMVYAIAKHEQIAKKRPLSIRGKRKRFTLSDNQKAMVEALPKIGPRLAVTLLEHFGSVEKVLNADVKELIKVEGVGKKKAEEIVKVIRTEYGVEE
ncbi:hypothetical protein KO465_06530 [Candidatus Micrarchaeota archaeon]|nr:hypothetical protein [Candidatus Micrarchaeota archaeon]